MQITHDDLAAFIPSLQQPGPRTLLHVGCGTASPKRMPACFQGSDWQEVKLDIDPTVRPDIVASITDMAAVANASVDAVWSSHNLEHLETHQVPTALSEIRRVLRPGGFALINLPNLERIAQLITQGRLEDVLYTSPAGPVTALDMLFGHSPAIQRGNHYMAHRTGFTAKRLGAQLTQAGFSEVRITPGTSYDLWAVAITHAK
ncbi:class I SAM-dependent methyltransferase [Thauera aromatica]|uniref:class I SAM-dependent methyltransferase n=1 Tax=Thauera aromatica TaxID=59405 RepID=UPI001FFCB8A6|nr:class I SAM-dependent methyltransferase [Thauera aromatica]MCK2097701.1 methyltransferase domain-containing protein [Thauera aromatica]